MTPAEARAAARAADRARRRAAEDIERLCADAGISIRRLAAASGVPNAYVARIIRGEAKPSIETYAKLAAPLGADLSTRLYPNTGPRIRDRHQARIVEHLLDVRAPTLQPWSEVAVHNPVRGWIDLVLVDERARLVIATEVESDLRRLEQTIRWSRSKAEALPSWHGWPAVSPGEAPAITQLLVVRRTRSNRHLAEAFGRQLALAYPAHPEDGIRALTGSAPWPGACLIWAAVDRERVRLLPVR